ncbi:MULTISPECIES: calcium/sodium antiporter [Halorussus]|uniref:calcium/sodium antiporter n=1 Tax=Halorussus TaxID=1070314 RepID=UPI000E21A660|nr:MULTISPECIES: calcium/sodium antiporter [Halorussus]NHN59553.1 calcium/sodium antiporter [Halorussus sp. JP-T4]
MADATAVALDLGVVAASVGALWVGAKLLVENAARIARRAGLSELVVGLTVVGFGTSTPELATSVDAALVGAGDVAVANVVGSNLFNVGVVLALVGLLNPVPASRGMIRRDGPVVVGAAVLAAAVVRDGVVARTEGAVLVALLAGYVGWLLARGGPGDAPDEAADDRPDDAAGDAGEGSTAVAVGPSPGAATADGGVGRSTLRSAALAVGGLAVILVGANFLVASATDLARLAGVSEWAIGETVVAVGTSTPEIAASVVAARRGNSDIAAGNLLGSNVFNALGILGVAAVVRPLSVSPVAFDAAVWLVALSAFVVALLATKGRLTRPEGLVALAVTLGRWTIDAL